MDPRFIYAGAILLFLLIFAPVATLGLIGDSLSAIFSVIGILVRGGA